MSWKVVHVMNDGLADIAKLYIARLRKDENIPVSLQLRFWETWKKEKFNENISRITSRVRGLTVNIIDKATIILSLKRNGKRASALVKSVKPYIAETLPTDVYLVVIVGKRDEREVLAKVLHRIGMRRGWLKQVFVKKLDEIVISHRLKFELLSLVYELRMYKGRVFTAAGTANFWPRGVESIKEALEEYLLPIEKTRGYYIFIKSLRFRILKDGKNVGTYSVDRWGRITIGPRSDVDTILKILSSIIENILNNYIEYRLHYSVRVNRVKSFTAYYLEKANSIYLSAIEPGSEFFNTVKLMVGKPSIWNNKLIILPVEVGNPRLTARIIDKHSGMAVTLIATYNGIRLVPAPGSIGIDAEMIDHILAMFRNLVSE